MVRGVLIIAAILVFVLVMRNRSSRAEILSPAVAFEKLGNGALLLDVRTPEEFASGHLDGALNIPYDQLPQRLAELGGDRNRAIVTYCRSGRRSGISTDDLTKLGYAKVYNAGGYESLRHAKRN